MGGAAASLYGDQWPHFIATAILGSLITNLVPVELLLHYVSLPQKSTVVCGSYYFVLYVSPIGLGARVGTGGGVWLSTL